MNSLEKLTRARIRLQGRNPFFSYLSLFIKFKQDENLPKESAGAGIDIDGNFYYREKAIQDWNEEELQGVLCHEIMHMALLHLTRFANKDRMKGNIATDICINTLLKTNGFRLPNGVIMPEHDNTIKLPKDNPLIIIKDCDKKNAEQIYDEIDLKAKELEQIYGSGDGDKEGGYTRIDTHFYGKGDDDDKKGKKGKGRRELTDAEKKELEKQWTERVLDAYVSAQLKGDLPAGIDRLVGKLHENKVNWRNLLQRYIQSNFIQDYTYAKPNKKSVSSGIYMPDYIKEKIDIMVVLDLSGSVGDKELTDFKSEIVGIAKAFRNKVAMRVLSHDTQVQSDYHVENGDIAKIMALKLKGGGGTAFQEVMDYINEKHKKTKLIIWLTDGYGTKLDKKTVGNKKILWILTKGGSDELLKEHGKIIELKD